MISPTAAGDREHDRIGAALRRELSRRTFLRFCGTMAAVLALPPRYVPRIVAAVDASPRIPLIWLRGQGCGADGEALFRSSNPTPASLFLDLLSLDYLEVFMAAAGEGAIQARLDAAAAAPNGYIAVVEGAISRGEGGAFHTVAGRAFADVAAEVCRGALATIAVGSCAFDGGLAAAAGGSTGADGVGSVAGSRLLTMPGCPVNAANLAAAIVHFLTFRELPPADGRGRPYFAYGSLIHNQCERRAHFEFGEFVENWGDEGAQKNWCLYRMGCKGPEAFANCPTVRYADGVSWPIKSGQVCIGCTMPGFWDSMGPVYSRLPAVTPLTPWLTADAAGLALVGGTAALATVHGSAAMVRAQRRRAKAAKAAVMAAPGPPEPPLPEPARAILDDAPIAPPEPGPPAVEEPER